jgi:hypothetical protein
MVHTDMSELKEKAGVTETVIKEGRFKAALIEPLTAESHAHLQGMVTQFNDMFLQAVARGRGTTVEDVVANYGEGGVVSAKQALESNMVDGIRTYDEILSAMLDGGGTVTETKSNGGSGFSLRASLDKEKEHSEPGTGVGGEPVYTPQPDEQEDKFKKGERLQRPPNIPELEDKAMDRNFLEAQATKLGIDFKDLSDTDLATKINETLDAKLELVSELEVATKEAQKKVAFAEAYPEEAARLAKLEAGEHLHEATSFANRLADFKVTEGEGEDARETSFRLSSLAQEEVKQAHVKLSQGNLVHADLETLIKTVATGGVEQGERGSSRENEDNDIVIPAKRKDIRQKYADTVAQLMTEDKLDRKTAIQEVAKRHPELAEAYVTS